MPIIPSGGFIDVRVLSVLVNEPIALHYIVRRTPHTFETEFLFLVREVDLKILRSNNKQLDDINADKTEAAIRLIINSVCQNSNVYASPEEIKCLKSLGIISPRVPKIALISPSTLIKLLRHFSDDLRAIAFECVLICLLSEFSLLSNTITNLKSAVHSATQRFSLSDPEYAKHSRNKDNVLLHDNLTSTNLMINYHNDKVTKFQHQMNTNDPNNVHETPFEYRYPTTWQHHYGDNAPALSIPAALDLSEQLSQPLTTHSTNIWASLIDQPNLPALTQSSKNIFNEKDLADLMNNVSLDEKTDLLIENKNAPKLIQNKNHPDNNKTINYRASDVKNDIPSCQCCAQGKECQCCDMNHNDDNNSSTCCSPLPIVGSHYHHNNNNNNNLDQTETPNKLTLSSQVTQADTSIYTHRNAEQSQVPDIFAIDAVVNPKLIKNAFVGSLLPSEGLCQAFVGCGYVKKFDGNGNTSIEGAPFSEMNEKKKKKFSNLRIQPVEDHEIFESYDFENENKNFDEKNDEKSEFLKQNNANTMTQDNIQLTTFTCHEENFTSILLAYRGAPELDPDFRHKLEKNFGQFDPSTNLNHNQPLKEQPFDGIHIILHHPSSQSQQHESDGSYDSDDVIDSDDEYDPDDSIHNGSKNMSKQPTSHKRTRTNNTTLNKSANHLQPSNSRHDYFARETGQFNEFGSVNALTALNKNLSRHAQTQNFLHRISQQIPLNQFNVRTQILYPAIRNRYNREETSSYVQFRFAPLSLAFIPFFFIPQIPLSSRQAFLNLCGNYPPQMQFEPTLPFGIETYFASLDDAKFTNPLDFGKGREKPQNDPSSTAQQTLPSAKLNYLDNRLTLEFIRLIATRMVMINKQVNGAIASGLSREDVHSKLSRCIEFHPSQGSESKCVLTAMQQDFNTRCVRNYGKKGETNNQQWDKFENEFHNAHLATNRLKQFEKSPIRGSNNQLDYNEPSPVESLSPTNTLPKAYSNPLKYKSVPFIENPGKHRYHDFIDDDDDDDDDDEDNGDDRKDNIDKHQNNTDKKNWQCTEKKKKMSYSLEEVFSPRENCRDCRRDITNFYLGLPMLKADVDNGFQNVPFKCICDVPRHKKRDIFMSELYYPYYRNNFFPQHLQSLDQILSPGSAFTPLGPGEDSMIYNQDVRPKNSKTSHSSQPITTTITALNNPFELPDDPFTFKSMPYLEPLHHSDTNFISTPGIVPFSTLFSVVSLYSRHNYPFEQFLKESSPCQVEQNVNIDITFVRYLTFINSQAFLWLTSLKQPVVWSSTILEFDKELTNSFYPKNKVPDAYLANDTQAIGNNPFEQGVYGVNNPFDDNNDAYLGPDGQYDEINHDEIQQIAANLKSNYHHHNDANSNFNNPLLSKSRLDLSKSDTRVNSNFTIIDNLINKLNNSLEDKIQPGVLQTPFSQTTAARANKKQSQKSLFPTFSSLQGAFPYEITKETLPLWRSLLFHIEETLSPLHQLRLLRLCNLLTVVNPSEKVTIPTRKSRFEHIEIHTNSSFDSKQGPSPSDVAGLDEYNLMPSSSNDSDKDNNDRNRYDFASYSTPIIDTRPLLSIKQPVQITDLNYHHALGTATNKQQKEKVTKKSNEKAPKSVKSETKSARGRKTVDYHTQRLESGEANWDDLPTWVREKLTGGQFDPNFAQHFEPNHFLGNDDDNYNDNNDNNNSITVNVHQNNNDIDSNNLNGPLSSQYPPHQYEQLIQPLLLLGNSLNYPDNNLNFNPPHYHEPNFNFSSNLYGVVVNSSEPNSSNSDFFSSRFSSSYPNTSAESTPQYNNSLNNTSDSTPPHPSFGHPSEPGVYNNPKNGTNSFPCSPQYPPYGQHDPLKSSPLYPPNQHQSHNIEPSHYSALPQLQPYDLNIALSIQNRKIDFEDNIYGQMNNFSDKNFQQSNDQNNHNNDLQNNHHLFPFFAQSPQIPPQNTIPSGFMGDDFGL